MALAVFFTIAVLFSSTMSAPLLQRRGALRVILKSESTNQYIRVTEDGLVRNDAGKYTGEATCFEMRRPSLREVEFSTMIGETEYFLAMDSNGEVTAISEVDDDSSAEGGSGPVHYQTFKRVLCPFGAVGYRGMCLKMTIGDNDCFLNFNSNHLPANSCSLSARKNMEAMIPSRCPF